MLVWVLLADTGRWEQAVEAYATGMTHPLVENSGWFADMVGGRIDSAIQNLPEDIRQAPERRGQEGDRFDVLLD